MLRASILYLSQADWARRLVTGLPLAWRTASRFVAGEGLDDAIAAIRGLNARGLNATLDHLGESVTNQPEAVQAADAYLCALDRIAAAGVKANISLKLTQLGLDLDAGLCRDNLKRILERARAAGNFVRVDMEGTPHTDRTLALVASMRDEFDNVGTVLQSYLYRTRADLQALVERGTRVRLCKGAYNEPPELAYPRKADVDDNFVRLSQALLDAAQAAPPAGEDGRLPPLAAIATHDEAMIEAAKRHAEAIGLGRDRFEFQLLHGIRPDLQERLQRDGYAVRIYVPYGASWYPYFMRRLAERPANVWFFLSNLFRR